ncbi:MAG: NUDIX hydrolase YfcD [Candidatus Tectomicrobia bacterium]|nr:NUDIX hydrolase YfcD [Candidatus Tectomicrobia bacterium]
MSAEEIIDLIDEENRVIGQVSRKEMRAKNLLHRSTAILVWNSQGQLFVHKRTTSKDVYPGYFDVAAGGVVLAGETYEESAKRELVEELGIENIELTKCFEFSYADEKTRVISALFSCVYDGPMKFQIEEVADGFFIDVKELFALVDHEPFCPDGLLVLKRYLERGEMIHAV